MLMALTRSRSEHPEERVFSDSDARELDREFATYSRLLLSVIARQSLVVVLGGALLGWVELNTLWFSSGPRLLLPMASGEVFLASVALLAGLIGALQFMTRAVAVDRQRFRTLARRRFFSGVAHGLVAASIGIGLYGAYGGLSAPSGAIDLVRVFGPLCIGLLLAIVAADAAIGEEEGVDRDVLRLHNRETHVLRMRRELAFFAARVRIPSNHAPWWGLIILALPIVVAVAAGLGRPAPLWILLVRAALSTGAVVCVYTVVYQALRCVARAAWTNLCMWIALPSLIAVLLCLEAARAALLSSTADDFVRRLILMVGGLIGVGLLSTAAALLSIAPLRGRPGALRALAIHNATRRLARSTSAAFSTPKPPVDGIAVASLWVTPVIPMGAVLGVLALVRLGQATRPIRGRKQALAAITLTSALILILFVALSVLWVLNPS